ncbi:hypothetical protein [Nitrobacter sp. Nb-311A]|uniref:hypothetical protein n=1 Tax=Nitrobacter sp. Nb-311A TaxID=314253 RepID=UPI001FD8BD83
MRCHSSALCISDHHGAPSPWEVTAPHVYIRTYAPSGNYGDHYAPQALAACARRLYRII